MIQYVAIAMWCLIVLTAIVIYMPIMYIRKTDKLLKTLQQIEENTRKH